ncbi:MAG: hypothetical protein IANPNBLG_04490 [Bryobacteraceae bacterium]|nr:hypothetical protein [Bryobacteraceae bacterium]
MLHITNGDSVIASLEEVSMPGEFLSWRDILHEGPAPGTRTIEELSDIRARFVADSGWASYEEAREELARRDAVLARSREQDEVVLWFEHNLFDQLQLLQVLDWYYRNPPLPPRLSLIHPEGYLGVMPGEVLEGVFPMRQQVHPSQLELGHKGWRAFTSPEPLDMAALAGASNAPLPYLAANFERFLEEYPSVRNGLSRSEEQILRVVQAGRRDPEEIFHAFCEFEEPMFMGVSSVCSRLERLAAGQAAAGADDGYQLTELGERLLRGESDWIRECGGIDMWLGGVHLRGADAAWRWDGERKILARG